MLIIRRNQETCMFIFRKHKIDYKQSKTETNKTKQTFIKTEQIGNCSLPVSKNQCGILFKTLHFVSIPHEHAKQSGIEKCVSASIFGKYTNLIVFWVYYADVVIQGRRPKSRACWLVLTNLVCFPMEGFSCLSMVCR